jgi:hypothetical protein
MAHIMAMAKAAASMAGGVAKINENYNRKS